MIDYILKATLILSFGIVFFQDLKDRQVYWFLFPVIGGLCGFLFYKNTLFDLFLMSVLMNLFFITVLFIIVFLYATCKLKTSFFNTIGLGDLILFIGLSLSFSTISFIVIFICALIFSLVIHLSMKKESIEATVPLAGYMSLFFLITYISHWTGIIDSLYII
jgi:hypothetical protein